MTTKTTFSDLPTLETGRLYLRPIQNADAPAIFDYASDPEMTRYTLWSPHQALEDAIFFVDQILAAYKADQPAPWAILLKDNNQLIGTTGFVHWFPNHGRAEIGYAVARKYWGKGYAAESARAVLSFGFKKMQCNRIEALCNVPNTASSRVMEKIGMKYEGILREYLLAHGKYCDVKIYAILRSEWKES